MSRTKWQCGVCGETAEAEVVAQMVQFGYDYWIVHRIDLPALQGREAGVVQVLTCPACTTLTQDFILEGYKERIRQGLVDGYH